MFNTIQGCIRCRKVASAERFYAGLDPRVVNCITLSLYEFLLGVRQHDALAR